MLFFRKWLSEKMNQSEGIHVLINQSETANEILNSLHVSPDSYALVPSSETFQGRSKMFLGRIGSFHGSDQT